MIDIKTWNDFVARKRQEYEAMKSKVIKKENKEILKQGGKDATTKEDKNAR